MKIGELAKLADCQVETVRYYEREGLLPAPARTAFTAVSTLSGLRSFATAER